MKKKIALITGGNRGIGLEICRQLVAKNFFVILTCRRVEEGLMVAEALGDENALVCMKLDLEMEESILAAKHIVEQEYGHLDVLVNNAGLFLDKRTKGIEVEMETLKKTLETNTLGTILVTQTFLPLLKKSEDARIINVSSSLGQLENMGGGGLAYRLSKTGLNVMTRVFADELAGTSVKINAVSPGWVRTDMGGKDATLGVEEGADTIVWLATEKGLKTTGKFLKDRAEIAW